MKGPAGNRLAGPDAAAQAPVDYKRRLSAGGQTLKMVTDVVIHRRSGGELATGPGQEITILLQRVRSGDAAASDRLYQQVYDQLHDAAERCMRAQPLNHTLEPRALVNEAFLRMAGGVDSHYENRAHFLATAARAMRCALVDHARGKKRQKRGSGKRNIPLHAITVNYEDHNFDLLELNEALEKLGEFDEQARQIVELRYFAGFTVKEAAKFLGASVRQVERDWQAARAWLQGEMS